MPPPTPTFDIQNLFIIAQFDGNPSELNNFLKVSQTFLNIYWNREDETCVQNLLLFEGIKSRLTGRAKEIISVYGVNTWTEIKAVLIQNFGDQRNENSLTRDLVNLRQNNESPQQFYERFVTILISIMKPRKLVKAKKNFFRQQALVTFLAGLKEPLGSTIRAMRPDSLATAIQYIVEENNIRYLQRPQFNNESLKRPMSTQKPQQHNLISQHSNSFPRFNNVHTQNFNQTPRFPSAPFSPVGNNFQLRTNNQPPRFLTNQQVFGTPKNVWKPGQYKQTQPKPTPMSISTRFTANRPQQSQPDPTCSFHANISSQSCQRLQIPVAQPDSHVIIPRQEIQNLEIKETLSVIENGHVWIEVTPEYVYINEMNSVKGQPFILPEIQTTKITVNLTKKLKVDDIPLDKLHTLKKMQDAMEPISLQKEDNVLVHFWTAPLYIILFLSVSAYMLYRFKKLKCRQPIRSTQSSTNEGQPHVDEPVRSSHKVLFVPDNTLT
ncbi:hypothetical protein NQ317_003911 [Molorchus minor]|uniref:Retrotransposon gag domain-containing protein n=1 Tax=Molorchus minor TaxID=1323400 RepID=A0ABQ9IRQ7_9CUCU|nr:hypothetical protein NQ317_003911 [Molorchus minor]